MELFKELGANNLRFTYRVQADGEGRIKCLMWTNGSSRLRQASERFTGDMNPRALGWTQRVTIGAAASRRTPCPNRPSALEKAVRGFAENPGENVIVWKLGISFDL